MSVNSEDLVLSKGHVFSFALMEKNRR